MNYPEEKEKTSQIQYKGSLDAMNTDEQNQQSSKSVKGTEEGTAQHTGDNAAPVKLSVSEPGKGEETTENNEQHHAPYVELMKKLSPAPMTEEQKKKEAKRYKRDQIINAVGEGIKALSNLFFATKGAPKLYDATDNAIKKRKVTYDTLLADDKAAAMNYLTHVYNATKDDDAWVKQKEAAENAAKQRAEDVAHRDKVFQANEEQKKWVRENTESQQEKEEKKEEKAAEREDTKAKALIKKYEAQAKAAGGQSGRTATSSSKQAPKKVIIFSDGNNNEVMIHEDVWKGSMPGLFDTLTIEGIGRGKNENERMYRMRLSKMTAQERDQFVKQNWTKSDTAIAIMSALGRLDPNTFVNPEEPDDEPDKVIDYEPGMLL